MGTITAPHPVKLFIGMLSCNNDLIKTVEKELSKLFGPVDLESPLWPWEHTSYYTKEMGEGLQRKFVFFNPLIDPGTISEIKLKTNELETRYPGDGGGRRINLDPGYLDAAKLVLVSTKDFSHRIYLHKGIYGEVTLFYSGTSYQTLPYTFPDFRTKEYRELFKRVRELYKQQVQQDK